MSEPTIHDRIIRCVEQAGHPDWSLHDMIGTLKRIAISSRGIERDRDELLAILLRYRNETPLGHQPHMIAHEVDAILAKHKERA